MSDNSAIEWTDASWSLTAGCSAKSVGCNHCYAEVMSKRLQAMTRKDIKDGKAPDAKRKYLNVIGDNGRWNHTVTPDESALAIPLGWKRPRKVFVDSMSDLFWGDEEDLRRARGAGVPNPKSVPFDFIDKLFAVMALCPQHTFQILTKRPERMAEYLNTSSSPLDRDRWDKISEDAANIGKIVWDPRGSDERNYYGIAGGTRGREFSNRRIPPSWPLPNVWVGTSVENQKCADERIPHLLKCPAAVRFLSCEPLLGPIDLGDCVDDETYGADGGDGPCESIHWVIVGGESGAGARLCDVGWIRDIVAQCDAASVPVFIKQLGKWIAGPHEFEGWKGKIDSWLLDDGTKFKRPILRPQLQPHSYDERPKNAIAWNLRDSKGGDIEDWPADLRVREFPRSFAAPAPAGTEAKS